MNIFYAPLSQIQGNSIKLNGQEAIHASKALRYSRGDTITVVDGAGGWYEGKVQIISDKSVQIFIENYIKKKCSKPDIILGMGIIKKRDRLEFAVEKAVELGVKSIALFRSEHTVKRNIRLDRLQTIAVSAMKQSLQSWLPEITLFGNAEEVLEAYNDCDIVVAHELEKNIFDQSAIKEEQDILLLVGPEGGFSKKEIADFMEKGGTTVSLGKNRLRTETAVITLLSQFIYRDL